MNILTNRVSRAWIQSAVVVLCALMSISCGEKNVPQTPSEHAQVIAKEVGDVTKSYYNSCVAICEKFIKECNTDAFETRDEARVVLESRLTLAHESYTIKLNRTTAKYDKAKEEYRSNVVDYNEFVESYSIATSGVNIECDAARDTYEAYKKECVNQIKHIKPMLPDENRILKDLIGQAYYEDCNTGYFSSYHSAIPIHEDSKSVVEITSSQVSDLHVVFYTTVTTRSYTGGCFIFDFKLTYSLPSNRDDWHLDTIILNNLMPEITGKHNDKVSVECVDPPLAFERIVLKNNSDSGIVVGITYTYDDGSTRKRAYRLSEYESDIDEYVCLHETPSWKIDFVELL